MTSTRKTVLALLLILLTTTATAYYYNQDNTITQDNYFSTPQYDSQKEIATKLVLPFLFIVVVLNYALEKALITTLADEQTLTDLKRGSKKERKKASKYATVMAITIAGSLIPTPYWQIIQGMMNSIGILGGLALLFLFTYTAYKMFSDS